MSGGSALFVAFLLLLGNAFFVGAEFALISARRSQIEPRAQAGSRMARITLTAMENISLVIGVNQLGITVCSLLLGAIAEPALAHLIEPVVELLGLSEAFVHPIAFALALSIVVYLHVVLGEMVPKNIALAGPDRAAVALAPAVWVFVTVLRPVVLVLNAVARAILRLVGVELQQEVGSTYTREEVAALVEESRGEGLLADDEYGRLSGALGFAEKNVDAVVMATGYAHHGPPWRDGGRRRGRLRRHRVQPVPRLRRRRRAARLPAHQGRARDRGRAPHALHRRQVDQALRRRTPRRLAPGRARDAAAPRRAHGARGRTTAARSSAW